MPKIVINMRLDKKILQKAKKILHLKENTATVETALRNIINNREVVKLFKKTSGKSAWKGFKKSL